MDDEGQRLKRQNRIVFLQDKINGLERIIFSTRYMKVWHQYWLKQDD